MYPNSFSFLLISFIVTVYSFNVISLAFPVIPSCSLYFVSFSFSRSCTFSAIGVILFCNSRSASTSGEFTLVLLLIALVFGFFRVKLNFSAPVRSPLEFVIFPEGLNFDIFSSNAFVFSSSSVACLNSFSAFVIAFSFFLFCAFFNVFVSILMFVDRLSFFSVLLRIVLFSKALNFGTALALFSPTLYLLGVNLANLFRNAFLCSALSTALLPKFFGVL